jgi:SAM-dependent methyltransferase
MISLASRAEAGSYRVPMQLGPNIDNAWGAYWRDADVDGCTAAFPIEARDRIASGWRERLEPHSGQTLLDVACGKGAVLAIARGLGVDRVTGVDLAETHAGEGSVRTGIDARELPFAGASFDIVVSQFGVEYAGLEAAGMEAARVCRGRLLLLTHAAEGPVVAHARDQVAQVEWLQAERAVDRLVTHFRAPTFATAADIDQLLAACVTRAGADQNVSVLESFYRTAIALQDRLDPAMELERLAHELSAHAERLRAMIAAAPTRAALAGLARLLEFRGFTAVFEEEGTPPIGYWLDARRTERE